MHTLTDPLKSQKGECDITAVLLFLAKGLQVLTFSFRINSNMHPLVGVTHSSQSASDFQTLFCMIDFSWMVLLTFKILYSYH